ncbi:MAG TPA: PilZ domain-containing protein [Bryobacteraceae bacterium]|jgi:hypothetical protein|nr:PilZ domain-containing protein [Bryobacteraceae bacterium]
MQITEVEGRSMAAQTPVKMPDRRTAARFPIQLDVQYREMGRRSDCVRGYGVTKNIGGKGILLTSQHVLRVGARVELSMDWPFLLDGKTLLRLVLQGRVIRSENKETAVAIERHEFRTRSAITQ